MTKRIDKLIARRSALAAEWRAATLADRPRIEIELDRATTLLADLTGLGAPLSDLISSPPALFAGRRRRRRLLK
jgi:hypothetical protein